MDTLVSVLILKQILLLCPHLLYCWLYVFFRCDLSYVHVCSKFSTFYLVYKPWATIFSFINSSCFSLNYLMSYWSFIINILIFILPIYSLKSHFISYIDILFSIIWLYFFIIQSIHVLFDLIACSYIHSLECFKFSSNQLSLLSITVEFIIFIHL